MRSFFFISVILLTSLCAIAQKDTLKVPESFKTTANVQFTNNGVSLFPNLMLGKPATIINISMGKKNFFFEPELRWRINGEPWSYIFWLRYRPKRTEHFSWHTGFHPSYVLRKTPVEINGKTENRWVSQRFVAVEAVPVWHRSSKFALGFHALLSKGLDAYGIQKSSYMSLQPRFPNVGVSKDYYLGFFPQVFHLTLDQYKGTYYSQMLSFNKKKYPVYLSSIFTYKLKSTIVGDDIVWNVGLNFRL